MRHLILVIFALSTTACSTTFLVPANRFEIPETNGKSFQGEIKSGIAGTGQVQVADDLTAGTPNTTPLLSKNSSVYLGADLSIIEKLDIYYNSSVNAPAMLGVKFQILGEPRATSKEGNFSLSIATGYGFGNRTQTSEIGSIRSESKLAISGYEMMVLLGYRTAENFILYATPFKSHLTANCDIYQTSGGTTTLTADPDGSGDSTGINVGFRWGKNFFFQPEVSYINMDWTREKPTPLKADSLSPIVFGAVIGGAW